MKRNCVFGRPANQQSSSMTLTKLNWQSPLNVAD